jgi:polyhydroxyalkanoate synthesis regulator phasin
MVPTASGETDDVDVERLLKNMRSGIGSLGDLDETVSSLVTPSCGTGTLNAEVAKKIFDLTVRLADRLKERAEKL